MELTDVSTAAGAASVKARIDAMTPLGGTDVPEGMAWGWRTLSSKAPFTGGRSEIENGNDKVVIVLTDGANTCGVDPLIAIPYGRAAALSTGPALPP